MTSGSSGGIGGSLGGYEIVRPVRAATHWVVYEVRHDLLETRGLLRMPAEALRSDSDTRTRFRREALTGFGLMVHPHIQEVVEFVEEDGVVGVVEKLIVGESLAEALRRDPGPRPWAEAWRLLSPILDAMAFAHDKRVVHGALSPSTVLLSADGESPGKAVVTAFGADRILDRNSVRRLGPTGYRAPEQYLADHEEHPWADVWALGALAFRLVTGRPPVDPDVVPVRVGEGPIEGAPIPRLEGVPSHVADAVAAALSPLPAKRPPHATALRMLLRGDGGRSASSGDATTSDPLGAADGVSEGVAVYRPAPSSRWEDFQDACSEAWDRVSDWWELLSFPLMMCIPFGIGVWGEYMHTGRRPWPFSGDSPPQTARVEPGEVELEGRKLSVTRPFELGLRLVTPAEWVEVQLTSPGFSERDSGPATGMSWLEAASWLNALSLAEGLELCYDGHHFRGLECGGYRLPTEAEWELAASRTDPDGPRILGAGASEWVGDWFGEALPSGADPLGATTGVARVRRGLSEEPRSGVEPDQRNSQAAFRVARTLRP